MLKIYVDKKQHFVCLYDIYRYLNVFHKASKLKLQLVNNIFKFYLYKKQTLYVRIIYTQNYNF